MGHKTSLLILSAWLALMSVQASALGLGAISLKSNLNQPLVAEIELLELRGLSEPEVLVGLATQEDFDRVGVERNYFLTDLSFNVDLSNPNRPIVRIASNKLVREPYLNFVILVRWPSGKLLREYTVLMDLPIYESDSPAPVVSAQSPANTSRPPSTDPQTRFNPRSSFAPVGTSSSTQSTSSGSSQFSGDSYRVAANDTLWEIALEVRPDRGTSVHKTMIAIQQTNPESFINNNINLLKKGQILRIPAKEDIESINQRQAVVNVSDQIQEWSESAAPLDGARNGTSTRRNDSGKKGRVKLSSSKNIESGSSVSGAGSQSDAGRGALESQLAATHEELDKASRDNRELRSKVLSLEEQIKTMERMVEVSSNDMKALEIAAKQREKEAEQASIAAAQAAQALAQQMASRDQQNMDRGRDGALSDGEGSPASDGDRLVEEGRAIAPAVTATSTPRPRPTATPSKAATPKPTAKPAPVRAAPEKGFVDILLDNILYLGLALLVIVAVAAFVIQRKMADSDFDDDDDDDDFLTEADFPDPDDDVESGFNEEFPSVDAKEEDTFSETLLDEPEEIKEEVIAQEEPLDSEPQTEDVVAEADIYIAYGKYDKAEDMLLKALNNDPQHHDARLKLLETYAANQDVKRFDPHFAKLVAVGSIDITDRAESLRESIQDAPAFKSDDHDTAEFEKSASNSSGNNLALGAAAGALSLGAAASSLDYGNDDKTQIKPAGDSALELDNLDFGLEDLDSDNAKTSVEPELELDLDLDLGSSGVESSEPATQKPEEFDLDFDDLSFDEPDSDLDSLDVIGDEDATLEFDLGDVDAGLSETNVESTPTPRANNEGLNEVPSGEITNTIDLGETQSLPNDLDDDLSLDDLDLSALDNELEAMAKDLDGDIDDDLDSLDMSNDSDSALGASSVDDSSSIDDLDFDLPDDLDDMSSLGDFDLPSDSGDVLQESPSLDLASQDSSDLYDLAAQEKETKGDGLDVLDMSGELSDDLDSSDFTLPDIDPDSIEDDDLDFLSDSDETATKLDLARAYIDMGDAEGAKDIIDEIIKEGNDQHKEEAEGLLSRLEA